MGPGILCLGELFYGLIKGLKASVMAQDAASIQVPHTLLLCQTNVDMSASILTDRSTALVALAWRARHIRVPLGTGCIIAYAYADESCINVSVCLSCLLCLVGGGQAEAVKHVKLAVPPSRLQ